MILYFSGTGNSLKVAQQIAEQTNDEILHINEALRTKVLNCNRVGFVFPVYNNDIPVLVKEFIMAFDMPACNYVFGIITHGGDKGNALLNLTKLLNQKGVDISYTNDVLMPVSSRIMYGMVTDKINERTGDARVKVEQIAREIDRKIVNLGRIRKKHLPALMNRISETPFVKRQFTPKVDSQQCTNCGICSSVCPAQNISLSSGKAFVGDNCMQCMTCMHWCPQLAIHYKNRKVQVKQQYHHPEVKLKELIINK